MGHRVTIRLVVAGHAQTGPDYLVNTVQTLDVEVFDRDVAGRLANALKAGAQVSGVEVLNAEGFLLADRHRYPVTTEGELVEQFVVPYGTRQSPPLGAVWHADEKLPTCVCSEVYGAHAGHPPDCPVRMEIERLRAVEKELTRAVHMGARATREKPRQP